MRIALLVLVVGCSSSSNPAAHDGPLDGTGEAGDACAALTASITADLNTPGGSCVTANDCALVGGGGDQCESGDTILDCGGVAFPTNSPAYAQLVADLDAAYGHHCTTPAPYDCAPSYATCEDGHCHTNTRSCLDPIPDAPTDAGPATDAP